MVLGFRTKWKAENMPIHMADKPTYFVEKIWQSFPDEITADLFSDYIEGLEAVKYDFGMNAIDMLPKLHTIRKDEKNLWKPGRYIHFVIKNRTPQRFQFAPVLKCISTQRIEITYDETICERECSEPTVFIDGKFMNYEKLELLALNDGFDSIEDFFSYFNTDFKGKIIHWTDYKY